MLSADVFFVREPATAVSQRMMIDFGSKPHHTAPRDNHSEKALTTLARH